MRRSWPALALAVLLVAGGCVTVAPSSSPGALATGSPPATDLGAGPVAAHELPGGATGTVDDATWALAERITAPQNTSDTFDAVRAALAGAGIAVVADDSTDPVVAVPEVPLTGTASPFELLDFQAHALAVGAWAGAGWTGAELDSVVPVPETSGAPTLAELMAAYAATADSPGGALVRALLAGQDLTQPESVRFPALVMVLFVSDVATDGGRVPQAGGQSTTNAVALLPLAAGGTSGQFEAAVDIGLICGGPSAWIDAIVSRIEQAITLAVPQNTAGAIIVGALNWLINIGASIVKSLVNALTEPVLAVIRSIAAIASGVAEHIASLLPYAVHVTASGGDAPNFFLTADPIPGFFDVQVTGADLPAWPPVLAACAQAAGIALPDFNTRSAPLTFGPLEPAGDPLIVPGAGAVGTTVTDDTGQAHWPFQTAPDPGQGKGTYTMQTDTFQVAVHRPELDDLRTRLTSALLGEVPGILRPYVAAILQPILDGIQGRLNKLLDARGTGYAYLWFHRPVPPTPTPSVAPSGPSACAVSRPVGTYSGTLTVDVTTIVPPGEIDLGEHGGDNDHGTGPLTVNVAADGTLSGSLQLTMLMHAEYHGLGEGTTDTTVQETGAITGTLCSLTLAFASETVTACQATGYGTCGGVGTTIALTGLVPPLPLGAPTSLAGGTITWSISSENGFNAGFGGLSADTQSTITATLQDH